MIIELTEEQIKEIKPMLDTADNAYDQGARGAIFAQIGYEESGSDKVIAKVFFFDNATAKKVKNYLTKRR